jgi:hypothetical protein
MDRQARANVPDAYDNWPRHPSRSDAACDTRARSVHEAIGKPPGAVAATPQPGTTARAGLLRDQRRVSLVGAVMG